MPLLGLRGGPHSRTLQYTESVKWSNGEEQPIESWHLRLTRDGWVSGPVPTNFDSRRKMSGTFPFSPVNTIWMVEPEPCNELPTDFSSAARYLTSLSYGKEAKSHRA